MKRKVLLLSLLLASAATIMAQDPIVTEGKEWHLDVSSDLYSRDVRMWIEGDTIVDGVACKRFLTHTKQLWDGCRESLEVGYCRQDGDRYYQNGELMFDLGMQVGDTITFTAGAQYLVKAVGDTILSDGVTRRYQLMMMTEEINDEVTPYNSDYWVEGIGSLSAGILTCHVFRDGFMSTLLGCSYNGQYLYRNVGAGIEKPLSHLSIITPYYDLQGHLVDNPTCGIYIKGGKKVVIK